MVHKGPCVIGYAIPRPMLSLVALVLTLRAYLLGLAVHRRLRSPAANPVLLAILVIGIGLRLLHLSYADYFSGAQPIHFLLGPATVALAIPLVRSLEAMRRNLWPMLGALLGGSLVGLVSGYGLVRLCGGSQLLALSMAPKSLTNPIAIGVSQGIGGDASLTSVLAIVAGVLVAVGVDPILRWARVSGPAARGLAAGTAGGGIGAAQVIPQHPIAAAFAGIALGLNGLLTAVLAPLLVPLLKRW